MKVVRQISTGKIAYRQEPEFEKGKGILNVVQLFKNIPVQDLEEIEITEIDWEKAEKLSLGTDSKETGEEKLIAQETRAMAVKSLVEKGLLPESYK